MEPDPELVAFCHAALKELALDKNAPAEIRMKAIQLLWDEAFAIPREKQRSIELRPGSANNAAVAPEH